MKDHTTVGCVEYNSEDSSTLVETRNIWYKGIPMYSFLPRVAQSGETRTEYDAFVKGKTWTDNGWV